MSPFPRHYLSTVHLPFNSTCLAGRFTPEPPDAAREGEGYWLLIMAGELLLREDATGLRLPQEEILPAGLVAAAPPLHIGVWDGLPCRVAAISRDCPLPPGWVRESFSSAVPRLSIEFASLAALAHQILRWEKESRYCAACSGILDRVGGGWGKCCPNCQTLRFPAIHPCVIVLIHRPGELLLARKAEWPAGRYSLVAGFLDFGEALEETVVREIKEETGVTVKDICYIGSQAWPFPGQIMAGFTAEYAGGELCVDPHELEDARWFSLDALPELPPPRSIARFLIDQHLGAAMGGPLVSSSFCHRRYRLVPARIGMLRFLVEGYDGTLFLRTIEASTAVVELSWSETCAADAEGILAALSAELEMVLEVDL